MAQRYKRRRMGDRKDGRRLHTLGSMFQLTPFLMQKPSDAVVNFTDSVEISNAEQWLRLRRTDGYEDISLMHVYVAAYVRTVAQYPALNRFVAGRFFYSRDTIDVIFSTGHNTATDGRTTVKVHFLPTDTIFDVCRKINAQWDSIRADEEASYIERITDTLIKTPRFVLRFGMAVFRWLDYHNWLGEGFINRSPFHGSLVLSDEGAFALPPVQRSLNSTGSLPMSISFGRKRDVLEPTSSGTLEPRRYVDYAVTADTRIFDHSYMGAAFKAFRHYLQNPDLLRDTPERVNEDVL